MRGGNIALINERFARVRDDEVTELPNPLPPRATNLSFADQVG
jgi:hypothetical protein